MADYHLSKKGEDFIDGHYREFQGSGGVSVDRVIQWLWWLRESGDFKANNLKLIEDVGNERAGNVLNWAVHKGYLEEDTEPDIAQGYTGALEIRLEQAKAAKDKGDESEYSRIMDIIASPAYEQEYMAYEDVPSEADMKRAGGPGYVKGLKWSRAEWEKEEARREARGDNLEPGRGTQQPDRGLGWDTRTPRRR